MPIPRYERQPINANTATEQLGGMADEAEARGQQRIAGAQQNLGAREGQRANIELQSFSQRLNMFTQQMDSMMNIDAQTKGREQAVTDIRGRRKKRMDIQEKYQNNPDQLMEKLGQLEQDIEKESFSVYGQVYNNSMHTAYSNNTAIDAENAMLESMRIADGDPEKFKQAFTKYRDEIVKAAPSQLTRDVAINEFEKRGVSTYEKMYLAQQNAAREQAEALELERIETYQDDIENYSETAQPYEAAEVRGALSALLQSRVDNGKMSQEKMNSIMVDTEQKATVGMFIGAALEYSNKGQWADFSTALYDDTTTIGQQFQGLKFKQQEAILNHLDNIFETTYKKEVEEHKASQDYKEMNSNKKYEEMLSIDNVYTESQLTEMVATKQLSVADADRYRDFKDMKTDQNLKMEMEEESTLVALTPGEIKQTVGLSWEDKNNLINKRQKLLDTKYNWANNDMTSKAYGVIKRNFGLIGGLLGGMGMDAKNKVDMNDMISEFEVEVNNLSIQDQANGQKIYSIAQDLVNRHNSDKAQKAKELEDADNERRRQEIEASMNEYNDGFFVKYGTSDERTFLQQAQITLRTDSQAETKKELDRMGVKY